MLILIFLKILQVTLVGCYELLFFDYDGCCIFGQEKDNVVRYLSCQVITKATQFSWIFLFVSDFTPLWLKLQIWSPNWGFWDKSASNPFLVFDELCLDNHKLHVLLIVVISVFGAFSAMFWFVERIKLCGLFVSASVVVYFIGQGKAVIDHWALINTFWLWEFALT